MKLAILTLSTAVVNYSSLVAILLFIQHFSVVDALMHEMLYHLPLKKHPMIFPLTNISNNVLIKLS